jgi:DNA-binding beta-propeller fold protein YncE
MDYNAFTSEVYIPDMQNKLIDVLSPIFPGTNKLPHEPGYTIRLGVAPQSIAITNDGQLGFIALEGGNVAMLDIPGKQVVNTILVGGNPRFIITGLYPPLIGTTPQEASIWGTVINVAAYVLVIALLIVPIVLFQRYARSKVDHKEE